jgi:hypothetical protein
MTQTKAERAFHQRTKARCFNDAWEYLEKRDRAAPEDLRMITLAHTARFHAGLEGTAWSEAVGDWQISRVYAAMHEPSLALAFAQSCVELCEKNGLADLLCTAFEAMARAHAVGGNVRSATKFIAKARQQLEGSSVDAEDRAIFRGQIRETERLIRRARAGASAPRGSPRR